MGPNLARTMTRYNNPRENGFGTQGLDLEEAIDRSRILGWLESILRWILTFFYRLVPNYGVAIILLTIVIKIVLYPITKKSYESTSKMQDLNPKIQEIKEKYKDNPQKMNQEMSALYKREGVSPLGGCLPLLLQMPIFIALYGLLNRHFALRGATFIPGWINDLSSPESILNFAPTSLPVIGSDIRLLPILFVGTPAYFEQAYAVAESGLSGEHEAHDLCDAYSLLLYPLRRALGADPVLDDNEPPDRRAAVRHQEDTASQNGIR